MYLKLKLTHCCYLTVTVNLLLSVIYWRPGERAALFYSRVTDPSGGGGGKGAGPRLSPPVLLKPFALRHQNVLYIFITTRNSRAPSPAVVERRPLRFRTNVPTAGDRGREAEGEDRSYQRLQSQTSPPCSLLTGPGGAALINNKCSLSPGLRSFDFCSQRRRLRLARTPRRPPSNGRQLGSGGGDGMLSASPRTRQQINNAPADWRPSEGDLKRRLASPAGLLSSLFVLISSDSGLPGVYRPPPARCATPAVMTFWVLRAACTGRRDQGPAPAGPGSSRPPWLQQQPPFQPRSFAGMFHYYAGNAAAMLA